MWRISSIVQFGLLRTARVAAYLYLPRFSFQKMLRGRPSAAEAAKTPATTKNRRSASTPAAPSAANGAGDAIRVAPLSQIAAEVDLRRPFHAGYIGAGFAVRKKIIRTGDTITTIYVDKSRGGAKLAPPAPAVLARAFFEQNAPFIRYFCPALLRLVEADGEFVGYQTRRGTPLVHNAFFERFFNLRRAVLEEFAERSGYYYDDWKADNLIWCKGRISLIDLDAFRPIQKAAENRFIHPPPAWYATKVRALAGR